MPCPQNPTRSLPSQAKSGDGMETYVMKPHPADAEALAGIEMLRGEPWDRMAYAPRAKRVTRRKMAHQFQSRFAVNVMEEAIASFPVWPQNPHPENTERAALFAIVVTHTFAQYEHALQPASVIKARARYDKQKRRSRPSFDIGDVLADIAAREAVMRSLPSYARPYWQADRVAFGYRGKFALSEWADPADQLRAYAMFTASKPCCVVRRLITQIVLEEGMAMLCPYPPRSLKRDLWTALVAELKVHYAAMKNAYNRKLDEVDAIVEAILAAA